MQGKLGSGELMQYSKVKDPIALTEGMIKVNRLFTVPLGTADDMFTERFVISSEEADGNDKSKAMGTANTSNTHLVNVLYRFLKLTIINLAFV